MGMLSASAPLPVLWVPLTAVKPHPANYRQHPPAQVAQIAASLQAHGFYRNVVVARDRTILAGHGVVLAAQRLGLTQIPIIQLDLDPHEPRARQILIGDNYLAQGADDDLASLQTLLHTLAADDPTLLLGTGFDVESLAALLVPAGNNEATSKAEHDAPPQIDRAEELREQWGVEGGQLWVCGEHRVMCGDCTERAVATRLLETHRASLCVTSPPYWVGKAYERERTWDEVQAFIQRFIHTVAPLISHRIVLNTGAPPAAHLTGERAHVRLLLDDYQRHLAQQGFLLRYIRIWAKRGGLAHLNPASDCIDQHWEFIGVFYRPENFEGQRRCGEAWANDGLWDDIPGTMSAHGHSAAFPLPIPARNIILYTDPGARVYDPFLGSGTTLIACENLNRICYGCEIDPGYLAVTLQRWTDVTGEKPRLATTG
jgi:hypothetical protein